MIRKKFKHFRNLLKRDPKKEIFRCTRVKKLIRQQYQRSEKSCVEIFECNSNGEQFNTLYLKLLVNTILIKVVSSDKETLRYIGSPILTVERSVRNLEPRQDRSTRNNYTFYFFCFLWEH